MKAIALTFDYNIVGDCSLDSIGRHWAREVYKDKGFIFQYSAASYATFIHHNPGLPFDIYTDDVPLLRKELSAYHIDVSNVRLIDWNEELNVHKRHKYPFQCVIQLVSKYKNTDEYLLKLDNDLICKSRLELDERSVLVWRHERRVEDGKPVWGEKYICDQTVGSTAFDSYNMGVMGLPKDFWPYHDEFMALCRRMIDVDISPITDVRSKIYHCCEQVAYNWIWHKYGFPIREAVDCFDHHYYLKENCLSDAKFLLRAT